MDEEEVKEEGTCACGSEKKAEDCCGAEKKEESCKCEGVDCDCGKE